MMSQRLFGPGASASSQLPGPEVPCPRTALRVEFQRPRHLEAHLARLAASAVVQGNAHPSWLEAAGQEMLAWLATEATSETSVLRLKLHSDQRLLVAMLGSLPRHPLPYRLVPMVHPLASRQRESVVCHKGLSGPWSDRILATAREQGGQDALLFWFDGSIAETAIASVGLQIEQTILIPRPEGRVASLAEALELPGWAADRGLLIRQESIPVGRIKEGQLWCMNEVRGIWPATPA